MAKKKMELGIIYSKKKDKMPTCSVHTVSVDEKIVPIAESKKTRNTIATVRYKSMERVFNISDNIKRKRIAPR